MFVACEDWRKAMYPGKKLFHSSEMGKVEETYLVAVREYAERNWPDLVIVNQYGTWAIDKSGIVHLRDGYFIEKDDLLEEEWPLHVSEKRSVDMHDFLQAWYAGRHHFCPHMFPSLQEVWGLKHNKTKRPRTKASVAGGVYLLHCNGLYKIGLGSDVKKRIKQLQTGTPFEITHIHTVPTATPDVLEAELHARFAHKRVRGEWFALDAGDVAYIKGL
jgi:hypothetical protein